jgi:hypothetical protein
VHAGYISKDVDALRDSQQRITDYFKAHGLKLSSESSAATASAGEVLSIRKAAQGRRGLA